MVVWLVGRFANRPYVRLDGCMDGEGWVCWWFGWCAPPPRALTLTLSRRAGEGMFVADEGVAAVMGCWLFGW